LIRRRSAFLLFALLLLAAPAVSAPLPEGDTTPLTNVDIVRMVMAGVPAGRILEQIRASPARFEVEPDILDELRQAGLPPDVIEAMIARMKQLTPGAESPHQAAAEPEGAVEILFEEDPDVEARAATVIAPATAPRFRYDEEKGYVASDGPPEPVRLAFFVVCTEPTHVPDHWSAMSPLTGPVERHHVLLFSEATLPLEDGDGFVYLDRPAAYRITLPAGSHSGRLGAAVAAGSEGSFVPWVSAPWKDLQVVEGEESRISVRVRSPEAGRRSRRGFMLRPKGASKAGEEISFLGDPRVMPRITVIGTESAPGAAEPPAMEDLPAREGDGMMVRARIPPEAPPLRPLPAPGAGAERRGERAGRDGGRPASREGSGPPPGAAPESPSPRRPPATRRAPPS
jgi:hypothetical protein